MAREENTVVIISRLKSVTHLYSGASEDASRVGRVGCLEPDSILAMTD